MPDSINRSELAALQAYVREYRNTVIERSLRGAPSLQFFTPVAGVRGQLILEFDTITDVVKRWQEDFSAGSDQFKREPVEVWSYFHTAEVTFSPKQDFFTYKGTADNVKVKGHDYPYAQWAMDKATKKIRTQMEFQQIFTGDQDTGANTANDMFNGLLTIIADDQALGTPKLTPFATGALNAANIITQVEGLDDSMDEEYRDEGAIMLVSPAIFRLYRRAYRAAAGYHPNNPDTDTIQSIKLDGSGTTMIACPGMRGSSRMILTHRENIYYSYDSEMDYANWEFELNHRKIDAWADYWFGAGFFVLDEKLVYINDQA